MNGIDPAIISRANKIGAVSARGEDLVVICAKMSRDEMSELEEAVSLLRNEMLWFGDVEKFLRQERMARRFLEMDFSKPVSDGSQSGASENTHSILAKIIEDTEPINLD
jgi:hypothetical protein